MVKEQMKEHEKLSEALELFEKGTPKHDSSWLRLNKPKSKKQI